LIRKASASSQIAAQTLTLLAVEKLVLVFLMLFVVLSEYEVHKNAVIVNYGE